MTLMHPDENPWATASDLDEWALSPAAEADVAEIGSKLSQLTIPYWLPGSPSRSEVLRSTDAFERVAREALQPALAAVELKMYKADPVEGGIDVTGGLTRQEGIEMTEEDWTKLKRYVRARVRRAVREIAAG